MHYALVFTELSNFKLTFTISFYKVISIENLNMEWEKILLCAGNFCVLKNSPLVLTAFGKTYFLKLSNSNYSLNTPKQSAGNFNFSTTCMPFYPDYSNYVFSNETSKLIKSQVISNTYKSYTSLDPISVHVPKHKSNFNDEEFGFFLAGLIEGGGSFVNKELHLNFSERNISLAYLIKARIGYGKIVRYKLTLETKPYQSCQNNLDLARYGELSQPALKMAAVAVAKAKLKAREEKIGSRIEVRYVCKHKLGMSIILSLINGKIVNKLLYEQMIKYNYSLYFNCIILPPTNLISLENH